MCNKARLSGGAAASWCLPEDIIVEILSWLPVVSLVRLKCICKTWRHMIEGDNELTEMHHNRAATCFRYKHMRTPVITFSASTRRDKTQTTVFCCIDTQKGLVLEQDRSIELAERFRIRNPATRQVVYLPVLGGTYWMLARMFFVGKSCCKVISFWQDGNSVLEGRFRAITVGADAAWRPLNNSQDLLHQISIPFRRPKIYALSIENVFHVVTMDTEPKKILLVDAEDERFKSTEIPETLFSDWSNVMPREWNSKLCLYNQDGNGKNINIWVLQNRLKDACSSTEKVDGTVVERGVVPPPATSSDSHHTFQHLVQATTQPQPHPPPATSSPSGDQNSYNLSEVLSMSKARRRHQGKKNFGRRKGGIK
nr:uncharacterized protein LOC109170984 [Ipomoea trifida]